MSKIFVCPLCGGRLELAVDPGSKQVYVKAHGALGRVLEGDVQEPKTDDQIIEETLNDGEAHGPETTKGKKGEEQAEEIRSDEDRSGEGKSESSDFLS